MSIEAVSWALNVPLGGNQKVILIGLANHAHPDGTQAYPALDTLAGYAHCDRSTVRRNLRKLVEDGWIAEDGHGPKGTVSYALPVGGGNLPRVATEPVGGGKSAPGGGIAVPPEPSIEPSVEPSKSERAPARPSAPPSLLHVFDHWRDVFDSHRSKFDDKRRRIIAKALEVATVEECCAAIDGLAKSEYHRKNGYTGIEYALRGGGREPVPETTIRRWAAIARGEISEGNGNGGVPTGHRTAPSDWDRQAAAKIARDQARQEEEGRRLDELAQRLGRRPTSAEISDAGVMMELPR